MAWPRRFKLKEMAWLLRFKQMMAWLQRFKEMMAWLLVTGLMVSSRASAKPILEELDKSHKPKDLLRDLLQRMLDAEKSLKELWRQEDSSPMAPFGGRLTRLCQMTSHGILIGGNGERKGLAGNGRGRTTPIAGNGNGPRGPLRECLEINTAPGAAMLCVCVRGCVEKGYRCAVIHGRCNGSGSCWLGPGLLRLEVVFHCRPD